MAEAILTGLVETIGGVTPIYLLVGALLGLIFGVLPGLGGCACVALLIPFTYGMPPHQAMVMIAAAFGAVPFGGSISAILLNVPGTAPNIATTFDGYPMTQKGRAGEAIGTSAAASALGAVFGLLILVMLIPVVRAIIMSFGPPEFFMMIMFGLVSIPMFTRGNFIKGLFAGAFGLMLAFVGFDLTTGMLRYSFGTLYLYDGIKLIPLVIGIFAISEAINLVTKGGTVARVVSKHKFSDVIEGVKNVFRYKVTFLRSSALGTLIGIIPGMGGVIANVFAWITAAQLSPNREKFGTGEVEGVVASESANNSKDGGALLPTLAFGIPGSAEMAVLLGAFLLHGLPVGPRMMGEHLDIVWAIIFALLISNILVALIGVVTAQHLARLSGVRGNIVAPIIICLSFMGAFAITGNPYDILVALIFGFVGFLMVRHDFSRLTLILGFVLGKLAEESFHQSLIMSDTGVLIFLQRPIAASFFILLILLVLFLNVILPMRRRKARQQKEG